MTSESCRQNISDMKEAGSTLEDWILKELSLYVDTASVDSPSKIKHTGWACDTSIDDYAMRANPAKDKADKTTTATEIVVA